MSAPPTTIRVTQEHIDAGQPMDCSFCPVAQALADAFRDYAELRYVIAEYDLEIYTASPHIPKFSARTPPEVEQFMGRFDNFQDVRPFEFSVTWTEHRL